MICVVQKYSTVLYCATVHPNSTVPVHVLLYVVLSVGADVCTVQQRHVEDSGSILSCVVSASIFRYDDR